MDKDKVYDELGDETQSETQPETQPENPPEQPPTSSKTGPRNRKTGGNTTKAAENKAKAADKVSQPQTKRNGKPVRSYTVMLNDSSEFPPGGLVLGKNGAFKRIEPEVPTKLDEYWMEVLNHAVGTEARRDESGRIVGMRNVPRFPYRIVQDDDEE